MTTTTTPPALLTIDEAAAYLHVSPRMIRTLYARRAFATVKLGRAVRISVAALDEFIAQSTRPANESAR